MLKFLFKRPGDKPAETIASNAGAEQKAAATASTKAARTAQAERLAALANASPAEREGAAADFIVQCDFSELRLAAAEFITSRAQLERVHGAIRNTDRRVAKLLQGRLDAIRHHDAEMARAQACLAQAATLLADDKLTPNQVAELDRRWSVIAAPELGEAFASLRAQLGARLETQVALQRAMIDRLAALRKLAAADTHAEPHAEPHAERHADTHADADSGEDDLATVLARMTLEQDAALAGPERASLPRQLVAEWAAEQARVQATLTMLAQGRAALDARAATLEAWTAAVSAPQPTPAMEPAPASPEAAAAPADANAVEAPAVDAPLHEAAVAPAAATVALPSPAAPAAPAAPQLTADILKREWQRLPKPPAGPAADAQQQRFEALVAKLPGGKARGATAERPANARAAIDGNANANPTATTATTATTAAPRERTRPVGGADPAFLGELAAMESALEQGSLHSAADHDKALKDSKTGKLSPAQAERLAHARAELKRLSDWARWGGNVSREELIKAVEVLSTQSLPMAELAKKVGSMRERWKALDTLSGAAPKTLWERFDAACTAAYAPAAAHFKQLAEERHSNAAKAEALIGEAQAQAARIVQSAGAGGDGTDDSVDSISAAVDWKQMAASVQRLRLAWSHLGAIDRKDKKRLDQQFSESLNIMQKPLEQQRKAEVAHREALIEQVSALDPAERGALDALRAAQERWQELARALPLERKAEQALWQRFRAACDAVFARRKETANAADAQRRTHQAAKEAISARLEQAALDGLDANAVRSLLRDAAGEWHGIGAVPRAQEAKVEQRYQAAVAALQAKLDLEKRAAGIAQASALRDKLRLCQQLEQALVSGAAIDSVDAFNARWAALPALPGAYERALKGRLDAALAVLAGSADRAAYLRKLEANRPILLQEVLRQEIAAGIDSGSEFARDRLKLQVEVLQSSLKSGQKQQGDGQNSGDGARFEQLAAMPALVDERTAHRIEQLFARVGKAAR